MSAITQQQWRLVRSVVDTGRLTAAARQLGISGPAASKMLRLVEARLGVPLFDRVGRTLRPTRFGLEFAAAASRVLTSTERIEGRARLLRRGVEGEVTVGCGGMALSVLLPPALSRLLVSSPAVRVRAAVEPFPALLQGLADGRLDMVVADPTGFGGEAALDGYSWRHLPPLQVPVVGRPGHPIFRRKAPTTADLLDYSWVLPGLARRTAEVLSAGLATVAPARRRALELQLAEQPHVLLSDPHACLEVAARTDCLTGAPEPMVQPYLDAGRLARVRMQLDLSTNIAAVWDPARAMTPAAERLLAALVSPDPGS